jgi:hypothetical protein
MAKKTKTQIKPPSDGAAPKKAAAKKRARKAAGGLSLSLSLAKARRLAGDLYEAAGHALWGEAIDAAQSPEREALIALQDAICDAADALGGVKALGLHPLRQYCIVQPGSAPRFVTAATQEEALAMWKATGDAPGEALVLPVPAPAATPQIQE